MFQDNVSWVRLWQQNWNSNRLLSNSLGRQNDSASRRSTGVEILMCRREAYESLLFQVRMEKQLSSSACLLKFTTKHNYNFSELGHWTNGRQQLPPGDSRVSATNRNHPTEIVQWTLCSGPGSDMIKKGYWLLVYSNTEGLCVFHSWRVVTD